MDRLCLTVDDRVAYRALAPDVALRPVVLGPVLLVALVLVAVAAALIGSGRANVDVFMAVQRATHLLPDTLWASVTICGTGVVAFGLLAPSLAWQPRWYAAGLAAAGLAGLYSNGLKRLYALPRPASVLDPGQLHVIGDTLRANSFPSGHAVTAFTLAAILVFASRRPVRTACAAVPIAMLIALSRIAVGAHWPADLAAGAAGGWLSGALGVMIIVRWRFWNSVNGVRVMALVSVGIGAALCVIDLGYPLAQPLQAVAAIVAIASGVVCLLRPRLDPLLPRASHP